MKTQVGMWIDHREANIVFLSQDGEETKQIKSNVEKQLRRSGDSASDEPFRRGECRRLIGAKKDTWVICLIITRRLYLLRVGQNLFLSLDPGRRRGNYESISINIISAD